MKFVMECGPCDGDLTYALHLVDLLSDYDDVAMKVQFYTPETITSRSAARYDRTDNRDLTQWDLFAHHLSYDDWAEIAGYAQAQGVEFFASVFSEEAVEKAHEMGIRQFKIASGDMTNHSLIAAARVHGVSLVVSTGAATKKEVNDLLPWLISRNDTLLACHLAYPSRPKDANLSRIHSLRSLAPDKNVGYSDHTPGIHTVAPLIALGATMWEKHFSAKTTTKLGDHAFAIRPADLDNALEVARATEAMLGSPDLTPTASELLPRLGARRSLASTQEIPIGAPVTSANTAYLRPATGLPIEALNTPMIARLHIPPYTTITADMVESP